ncbi:MAG: hypothetical protein COT18_04505, partial [Elusimicrobia bacterium CG08_land_8_20_14_0_20_59_10]
MIKMILVLISCLTAGTAGAQNFASLGNMKAADISALKLQAPAPKSGNYYLDPDSYDPLLAPAAGGEKINVIGGTIDIPGMDGTLDFARKYRQASYSVH